MKKKRIIMLLIIAIYIIISIYCDFISSEEKVVYLGNITKVYIENNKIKVKNDNYNINNKKVKLYFNNQFINAYLNSNKANFYKTYYAFDNNKNRLLFEGDLVATSSNLNIKILEFNNAKVTNSDLNSLSIIINKDITSIYNCNKYYVDLNRDSNIEKVFSFFIDESEEIAKEYIVVKQKEDYKILTTLKIEKKSPSRKDLKVFNFIDLDNDRNYEIILRKNEGGDSTPKFEVFKMKDDKYIKVK